jgi:hypothetical protein
MSKIDAPWTQEEVDALNRYQQERWMHPFTCGSGRRTDKDHLDGEGILLATLDGWICPFCDYRQNWAHEFMFQGPPEWAIWSPKP